MTVPPTATTGQNGSPAAFSSALAHGFMAETTSGDTSTIAFIQNMVIADQGLSVGRKQSLHADSIKLHTSRETKFAMGAAMWAGAGTKVNLAKSQIAAAPVTE